MGPSPARFKRVQRCHAKLTAAVQSYAAAVTEVTGVNPFAEDDDPALYPDTLRSLPIERDSLHARLTHNR